MVAARSRRVATALVVAAAGLVAVPAGAQADTAVGLVGGNGLVVFDTAAPSTGLSFRTITGLGAGESVRGIDVRPANGLLYAAAVQTGSVANSVITTYTIDPATGAATLVGATAAPVPAAADVPTGLDFNPAADRLRYVNVSNENARTNPNNGALAGDDPNITPALADVIGVAYDRNVVGATLTTAYVLNRATSQLATLGSVDGGPPNGSPNTGIVTDLGALGVTLSPASDAGFDISPAGVAYAAMTTIDNATRLYTINLATGAATAVGPIALGTSPIDSLAILPPAPAVPPPPPIAPPPPPIAPAPPPADRTAPKVLLTIAPASARLTPTSVKAIRIDFSCNEGCLVGANLRVGATTIASRSSTLRSADVARLRLGTTITQRNAIGRLKRAGRTRRGTLTMTFTDGAGNRRKLVRTIRLRP